MKTITVNVSEPVYREFQAYARQRDRRTSELIREAMDLYCEQNVRPALRSSLTAAVPISVGTIREPLDEHDDLLGEMTQI